MGVNDADGETYRKYAEELTRFASGFGSALWKYPAEWGSWSWCRRTCLVRRRVTSN